MTGAAQAPQDSDWDGGPSGGTTASLGASRAGSRSGKVRGVVPLFRTTFHGAAPLDRLAVAPGVVLVGLDEREQQRTRATAGESATARVEFHGFLPDFSHFDLPDLPTQPESRHYQEQNAALGERLAPVLQ